MTETATSRDRKQYERGRFGFGDDANREYYDRHLVFDHVVAMDNASHRERFEAIARTLRDLLTERWLLTQQTHETENPKRVYYLSMEFLVGRTRINNIINLGAEGFVRHALQSDPRQDWKEVFEREPDAGLGNGGLGRLAACFIDSLATLQIPAMGYGLRYEYGNFRQAIENGFQVEHPDHWLAQPDPWEVARPRETIQVPIGCSFQLEGGVVRTIEGRPSHLLGIPYDRAVVGYGGHTINTLRLWGAASPDFFNFGEFSSGDFVGAIVERVVAETVTRVLYPDDSTLAGQALRFLQEYFLVCCSLADIVTRFRHSNDDWERLPDKVAIQLNDTHPAIAVVELMRILLDQAELNWNEAWDLTVRTLSYTNHTLLPEALEKWPVRFFELVCPRLLEILQEVNRRLVGTVQQRYPGDEDRVRRMCLVEETPVPQVRMANLAIVGTHSTNGVARIHSDLLRTRVVSDFAEMYPERFNNKTNGVTPRRWLMLANPELSALITESIGDGWVTDLGQLRQLLNIFGLTAEQVVGSRGWYNPRWHYENEPETRAALDLIFNGYFSRDEPGLFVPIREMLIDRGDYFMHLADLMGYVRAHELVETLYTDTDVWAHKAIINIAKSGKFSSDRTIAEYASDIWNAAPCPLTGGLSVQARCRFGA